MRNARFFTVLTVGCLLPFSLSAQSAIIKVHQPAIKVAAPLPVEFHPPSVFPMTIDDSDRDLPHQQEETIQKSFSTASDQHRSREFDNVRAFIPRVASISDHPHSMTKP